MTIAALLAVVAAAAFATAILCCLAGRWPSAGCVAALGVLLSAIAPATRLFATPGQMWAAVAAAALIAPCCLSVVLPRPRLLCAAVAGGVLAGPWRVAVTDPFLDPSCIRGCLHNPFAVLSAPVQARTVAIAGTTMVVVSVLAAAWLARADRPRAFALLVAAGAALSGPTRAPALIALAAAVAIAVLTSRVAQLLRARRRVDDVVTALATPVFDVAALLGRRLGDPSVVVYHRVPSRDAFVDRHGNPEPAADPGSVTDLISNDLVVARVHHDVRTVELAQIAAALDPPARLAIENDRLAADLAVRAVDLALARRRIVARADGERRSLERDVHDSAQQHVLALGIELRVATAARPDDRALAELVTACLAHTEAALDDLRTLSRGIYPAQLEHAGIGPALTSLARRSSVPLDVAGVSGNRWPPEAAHALYAVVTDAVGRAAGPVRLVSTRHDTSAVVLVEGDLGEPGVVIPDRVASAGGTIRVTDRGWEVALPCGSS